MGNQCNSKGDSTVASNQQTNNNSLKVKHSDFDENDLKLIRTSWNQIKCSSEFKTIGANMMVRIFLTNPEVKYIWRFAANLKTEEEMRNSPQVKSHGYNVMEAVNAFVNSLDKSESSKKLLFDLGTRHISYGAKPEHFPIIGGALIETLKETLGASFTLEVSNAWGSAINYLRIYMSKGLEG